MEIRRAAEAKKEVQELHLAMEADYEAQPCRKSGSGIELVLSKEVVT